MRGFSAASDGSAASINAAKAPPRVNVETKARLRGRVVDFMKETPKLLLNNSMKTGKEKMRPTPCPAPTGRCDAPTGRCSAVTGYSAVAGWSRPSGLQLAPRQERALAPEVPASAAKADLLSDSKMQG